MMFALLLVVPSILELGRWRLLIVLLSLLHFHFLSRYATHSLPLLFDYLHASIPFVIRCALFSFVDTVPNSRMTLMTV